MNMVVWAGVVTVIFGSMAVQQFSSDNPWAGRTAVFLTILFDSLWVLFTFFRGVFA